VPLRNIIAYLPDYTVLFSLSNDSASNSYYVACNEWVIVMNWKGCGRKRVGPNSRNYPDICLQRLSKMMKIISQDNRSHGRESNRELP
jgi:hypothetical protein